MAGQNPHACPTPTNQKPSEKNIPGNPGNLHPAPKKNPPHVSEQQARASQQSLSPCPCKRKRERENAHRHRPVDIIVIRQTCFFAPPPPRPVRVYLERSCPTASGNNRHVERDMGKSRVWHPTISIRPFCLAPLPVSRLCLPSRPDGRRGWRELLNSRPKCSFTSITCVHAMK